jgi:putative PIN family toxin of toxin-antitoxin system
VSNLGGEGGLSAPAPVVIDTNIVLDLFVFDDDAAQPLRRAVEDGSATWLATLPMRVELERVLGYPQIVPRLAFYALRAGDVLAAFDRHARLVEPALRAPFVCKDADDQIFIDLAVAHGASLVSKDRAVLALARRLRTLGVSTVKCWAAREGDVSPAT